MLKTRWSRTTGLTAYRVITELIAKGTIFLLTILAARRLSREAFGLWALGATLGWMLGVVADSGLQMHVARVLARLPREHAAGVLQRWSVWRWTASAVALAAAAVMVARWFHAGAGASAPTLAVWCIAAAGLCGSQSEFYNHVFRGLSRSDLESTMAMLSRGALLAFGSLALWFGQGLLPFAVVALAVALATTTASAWLARRLVATVGRDASTVPAASDAVPIISAAPRGHEFVAQVLPVGLAVVLSALYFRIDLFLIERWQGAAAVGTYNAAFRVIEGLRLFPAAALAVALPELVRSDSPQPMSRLVRRMLPPAIAASLALAAAAAWLLPVAFGTGFVDAIPTFRVLVLGFPLMTINYVLTTQLVAWHRHRDYAWLCAAALALNVGLNAWLLPAWSITGAAWATVGTEVWLLAGALVLLRRAGERRPASLAAAVAV